jgi:hypothetical protein
MSSLAILTCCSGQSSGTVIVLVTPATGPPPARIRAPQV